METELYKSRSFSSCIKAAYVLFSTNIKAIFKKTWLPALIYALILSASVMMNMPDKALTDAGLSKPIVTFAAMASIYILDLAVGTWFLASFISLLNGKNFKLNLRRSIILTGLSLLITIVFMLVGYLGKTLVTSMLVSMKASASTMVIAPLATTIVLAIIFMAILLPFSYSSMKYLVDHATKVIDIIKKDYCRGWHHWGFLFATLLMVILILCILTLVLFIPFIIITLAQGINQLGMLDGDPSGVPSYFGVLLFVTTLITMYLFAYVTVWAYFVLYYAYGAIEALEKEKKEALLKAQKNQEINYTLIK